jgi:hypothetical protein
VKPGLHDITIYQGTTFRKVIIWNDDQDPPQPRNLTGYTARMQVRPGVNRETTEAPLIDLTTGDGITITGVEGKIEIVISAAETAALDFAPAVGAVSGIGVYDLELVSGSGEVTRLLQGNVTLDPEVTR